MAQVWLTVVFVQKKLSILQFYGYLTIKANPFQAWSRSVSNNLELVLYMTLTFYNSKEKLLKIRVKKFQELILRL